MSTISQASSSRFIAALGNDSSIQQDEALLEIKSFLQIYSVNDNIQLGPHSLFQPPLYWVPSTILWDFDSVYPRILILLEHGAELNVLYEVNSVRVTTPLHLVMTQMLEFQDSNTISLGRLLVSNGADPNFQADVCPLLCDCLELFYRSVDITVFLMEIGMNPNQVGKRGWTALMFAVDAGYNDNVDVLLRYGANPTYRSKSSETGHCHPLYTNISAIEFACAIGRLSCLELCLKYVCKGPTRQPLLYRALVIACESGHTNIVFFLLTKLLLPEVS